MIILPPGMDNVCRGPLVSLPKSVYETLVSEVAQLCPTLCDPMDCSLPAPPSMGFSRQEYWSGVPSPSLMKP